MTRPRLDAQDIAGVAIVILFIIVFVAIFVSFASAT